MLAKVVPALLTGNTIIVKPSPFTPYCDLKLGELAQAFFPPGVIQCLSGDDDLGEYSHSTSMRLVFDLNIGPWMTSHPAIDKISFTGSSATGKLVAASAAKTLKRVTLELGGNDPAIVCDDVDIPATAAKISNFAFFNSGQICVALKRIYIHESIYEEFRDAMVAHTKSTITVGNGKTNAFCGPIQNKLQYHRVQSYFAEIEKEKQKVAYGSTDVNLTGYFINPTIIDNPSEKSRLVVEEPFGMLLYLGWGSLLIDS
jgi:acyl-CoA reductase-like NAD-dependent aldehyde dehydrogenase